MNQSFSISAGSQQLNMDIFGVIYQPVVARPKINVEYQDRSRENDLPAFSLCNRRYLGNKHKLASFIKQVVAENCPNPKIVCDIFAGTGAVANAFNSSDIKVIANDILLSNYIPLKAFLCTKKINKAELKNKLIYLNGIETSEENYFSINFGSTYFSPENARKIGLIREEIENIADSEEEKFLLLTSLIYATDKIANTVGHYDAYRKKLDTVNPIRLLFPNINETCNTKNDIYREDANSLARRVHSDVLYMDPPYNSRQYCDNYHLLENLVSWDKPILYGKAKKMDRSHLKSQYCTRTAAQAFADLVDNADTKHILVSYNNTGDSKDGRSNARISDTEMVDILNKKGSVKVYESSYRGFTTGKSDTTGNTERIFYCRVK